MLGRGAPCPAAGESAPPQQLARTARASEMAHRAACMEQSPFGIDNLIHAVPLRKGGRAFHDRSCRAARYLNRATRHWYTGSTRRRAISVFRGHQVYESYVERFRWTRLCHAALLMSSGLPMQLLITGPMERMAG